jgi:hypothetical protein
MGEVIATYGDPNWRNLPQLIDDRFLFIDTSGKPKPGDIVACLMCAKPFLMPRYIGAADQICPECRKTYDEAAILVCRNCKVVICRLHPKVLDCGFYIRPRAILHSNKCNVCDPGLIQSTVMEIAEWMRTVRPHKPVIVVPGGYHPRTR